MQTPQTSNPNFGLAILFWCVFAVSIYRSQRRWKTFGFAVALALGLGMVIGLLLVFGLGMGPGRAGSVTATLTMLAVMVGIWGHSGRTRESGLLKPELTKKKGVGL